MAGAPLVIRTHPMNSEGAIRPVDAASGPRPVPGATRRRPPWLGRALGVAVAASVVLSLLCWLGRLHSTVHQGDLVLTTGFEDASVYNVWKARHGDPVYEWPDRGNYAPTFYNFLFYRFYAGLLDSLGVPNDARGLLAGRLLTSGFALFGVVGQYLLSLRLLRGGTNNAPAGAGRPVSPGERGLLLGVAGITWFSTNTTAWGTLTLRPDLAGLGFEVWGMLAWVVAWERYRAARPANPVPFLLAAAGCFFAAWGVKQSLVWVFAGAVLHALLSAPGWRWRALGWAGVPVGVAVLTCVWALGPEYRENTLVVVAAYGFSGRIGLPLLVQAAVTWFPLWWFAWPSVLALVQRGWQEGRGTALHGGSAPVVGAVVVAGLFNVFAAFKYGSSSNILLESLFLASALSGGALVRLARGDHDPSAPRWSGVQRRVAVWGWAIFLLLPAVQLALYAQGRAFTQVAGFSPGGLRKLDARDEALRRDFSLWLADLPKPLFTRDGLFVQPWHATDGRYPSFVIDFQATDFMRRGGLMRGGGVADFIRGRHFRSLLLDRADAEFYPVALAAGYRVRPLPGRFAGLPNEYGQPAAALQWLERAEP